MSEDPHKAAADEVWNAFQPSHRSLMRYDDFLLGFKLGRVSMKATLDKSESPKQPDNQPAAQ